MNDPTLIAAARAERDRRFETFPAKIRNGGDAEALSIEYQCWVAIAEWVETGNFASFHGGADPESENAPIIRFADLVPAAKAALDKRELQLAREGWFDGCEPTPTSERRGALVRIHRMIALHSETIDSINAELRRRRAQSGGGMAA